MYAKIYYTAARYLGVMFHYEARGLTCFCLSAFSFTSICTPALCCYVSRIQTVTAKNGAGLSHKHSAVVDWINTARLIFPLVEYPVQITVFALLSHGVTFAGSPVVWCIIANPQVLYSHYNRNSHQTYATFTLY